MSAIKEAIHKAYPGIVLAAVYRQRPGWQAPRCSTTRASRLAQATTITRTWPTSANKVKTVGEDIDARLEVRGIEPTGEWRLTPAVEGAQYPGNSQLNSNGEFLYFYGIKHGPRYEASAYGYLSSQSLLKNYLPTAAFAGGLGQPEPGQTIGNLVSIRQNQGYIAPAYALQMTPRRRLELNATFVDARYNHELVGGYTNYTSVAGTAALVLQATQRGSVALRAIGGRFNPDFGFQDEYLRIRDRVGRAFFANQAVLSSHRCRAQRLFSTLQHDCQSRFADHRIRWHRRALDISGY